MNRTLGLILAATMGQGMAVSQSTIYGIGAGPSPYTLYRISPTTGAGTLVGPIFGFIDASAIAFAPNGVLYDFGHDFFFSPFLLTINTSTGAATPVAAITGAPSNAGANSFAFRSDGVLFALFGASSIYTINTATAAATLIGSPGASIPTALAFSSSNVLYLADKNNLYTVNQATAATTLVTPLTYDPSFGSNLLLRSMKFDPATGTLYVAVWNQGMPVQASLGSINLATGAVTRIGASVLGLDGLAIGPALVSPSATPLPSSLLLLCIGLLALFGWSRWRALRGRLPA
jgi:hypothetical protein